MWEPETKNKTLSTRLPQWKDSRNKHIMILLGKDCEVKKMMRFLMDIGMFEKI